MPDTQDEDDRVLEDQKLVAERKDHVGQPLNPPRTQEADGSEDREIAARPAEASEDRS